MLVPFFRAIKTKNWNLIFIIARPAPAASLAQVINLPALFKLELYYHIMKS